MILQMVRLEKMTNRGHLHFHFGGANLQCYKDNSENTMIFRAKYVPLHRFLRIWNGEYAPQ